MALERWFWPCVAPLGQLSSGSCPGLCVGSWWCRWAGAVLCPVAGQGCALGQEGGRRRGRFSCLSLSFLLSLGLGCLRLTLSPSVSSFLSCCAQRRIVRMSLLKSPGKGSMCQGGSRSHEGAHWGSAHLPGLCSLLAVSSGKLFALLLFLLSSTPPLSSCSLSLLSLSPKPSCWQSRRACPALASVRALPALSHCSDHHLGRVLSGHLPARQAVPKWGVPVLGVLGRTHQALLTLSSGG